MQASQTMRFVYLFMLFGLLPHQHFLENFAVLLQMPKMASPFLALIFYLPAHPWGQ